MALWKFTNENKHGNLRSRIIYKPDGESLGFSPKGLGPTIHVKRFQYEYKHELIPPSLVVLSGKKYITPIWKEVEKNTTLNDIKWIKPKVKVKQEPIVEIHTSSSNPNKTYKTTYYPESGKYHCTCPGTWRTRGNCKHIKALRIKIEKNE